MIVHLTLLCYIVIGGSKYDKLKKLLTFIFTIFVYELYILNEVIEEDNIKIKNMIYEVREV